ncbi:MAG: winged helix-turn-helix transcriptional regulator [Clostridia bacterium]|nr:winged helix-turn-helix transcriptional regulator [Clostridia bacterium]
MNYKAIEENMKIERMDFLKQLILDENISKKLSEFYKVIGDGTRLKILYALSMQSLCVHEIVSLIGISQSLASHQLSVLKKHRLVSVKRRKNESVYTLADAHVAELLNLAIIHLMEEK